jgi:SAM-dependent methyltransferase
MKLLNNNKCRMCGSVDFTEVLDLGTHSLVNSYLRKKDLDKNEVLYPLVVHRCAECGLIQMLNVVDPVEIYTRGNYLYFSTDVPGLSVYFEEYADDIRNRFIKDKRNLIVEIACNDGILLEQLKDDANILGVDAAPNAVLKALKKGIPAFPSLFNGNISKLIVKEYGKADILMANNCIAHVNDLNDFMEGVDLLLNEDGVFIFETGYWGNMVNSANYEQIYHDHYCYFSVEVWRNYAKKFNLQVFDAVVTPAQDNCAVRVFLCRNGKRRQTERLETIIKREKDEKTNTLESSYEYQSEVKTAWVNLKTVLKKIKEKGASIAAYGASAKGGTIARAADLGGGLIDYYVDDSIAKHGLYTPIYHIPIISRDEAEEKVPDYFLILAVNYAENIMAKEKSFKDNGGKFIVPKGTDIQII